MIQSILVIYGLVLFLDALFDKWGIWFRLEEWGASSETKFIYKLTNCRFCTLTHLSTILTIIYFAFAGCSWEALVVPFVVSGLLTLKR